MKRTVLRLLTICLPCLPAFSGCSTEPETKPTPHVILIGSDGFSSVVMRNNPGAFPNIEKMMAEGSYTLERRSVLPSSSAVNWASMLMGAGPELHGYTTWGSKTPELPSRVVSQKSGLFPNIHELIREKHPEAVIGCIYQWPTIGCLYDQESADYNGNFETDGEIADATVSYIENNKPNFTFISFDEPDGAGHKFGWESEEYLEMCKRIDGYVGRILEAASNAGIADECIFIFTSDHGGINKGHGGKTMDEMEAPFILCGKGIKGGNQIDESVMMYDTASTLAYIFGVEQPQVWIGRPVMSIFE